MLTSFDGAESAVEKQTGRHRSRDASGETN
jgi:hypothetical protein